MANEQLLESIFGNRLDSKLEEGQTERAEKEKQEQEVSKTQEVVRNSGEPEILVEQEKVINLLDEQLKESPVTILDVHGGVSGLITQALLVAWAKPQAKANDKSTKVSMHSAFSALQVRGVLERDERTSGRDRHISVYMVDPRMGSDEASNGLLNQIQADKEKSPMPDNFTANVVLTEEPPETYMNGYVDLGVKLSNEGVGFFTNPILFADALADKE